LPTKEIKLPFPFTANKRKFAVSVSLLQQKTDIAVFLPFYISMLPLQTENGSTGDFP
jgi:hypothetical protein